MNWLKIKTGNSNIAFDELHLQSAEKGYKDSYVTGTGLIYQCLRVFSYETYAVIRMKDAVKMSMSVLLYFQPVYINDSGMVFKSNGNKHLHVMTDGGLSNYPIKMFDSEQHGACVQTDNGKRNPEATGVNTLRRTITISNMNVWDG